MGAHRACIVKHPRFFIDIEFVVNTRLELGAEETGHARVLRLHPGAEITLLNGRGAWAEAEIMQLPRTRRGRAEVQVRAVHETREDSPRLRLYIAPPRGKALARIVRQATELGVHSLIPVLSEYCTDRPRANFPDLVRPTVIAAMKQSGNPRAPGIAPPTPFSEAVAALDVPGYLAGPPPESGTRLTPPARLDAPEIAVWVGPEGGFSPEEQRRLLGAGLVPLALGRWILRTDTAVTAVLGWIKGGK